jgi:HK97 family phage prohead protease
MARKPLEIRSFPIEVRHNADGTIGFRGYAAVFDQESHGEVIERGAFRNSLAIRDNVKMLVNHDGYALASTDGGTMRLREDDHGLLVEVDSLDVDGNVFAGALVSALRRGDMNKMSFAFTIDGPEGEYRDSRGVRHVTRAKLWDVSVVNEPWYPGTHAELNSSAVALALRSMPSAERRALLAEIEEDDPPVTTDEDASVEEPPARTYSVAEARALLGAPAA